ncbi:MULTISPECIES: Arc family DNA-binding protein [Delftia]|uniref:Arc family DNA-binding protein n=1 Tax=Delftia acidovorans TaxID=80866 RepID=A0A7T2W0S4_DELAC|nr:Arc family DNA-binding protein [Delftia acidovorans]QPS09657.1 Arc family DNA-binding protein [Delftia acidovorans]
MKGKTMAPSEVQTNLRLPVELKSWLQEQAESARRSLTAEVVLRLEESRKKQQEAKGAAA